jgi:hypothetical protein
MNVDQIQSNLSTIILALTVLSNYQQCVLIDDGQQFPEMEKLLNNQGLAILIMAPQVSEIKDDTRKAVVLTYSSTVWVRTNPKIKATLPNGLAVWNPLSFEKLIIPSVIAWTPSNNLGQQPFKITPHLEPETDWGDVGNNSRIIRFATPVTYGLQPLPSY